LVLVEQKNYLLKLFGHEFLENIKIIYWSCSCRMDKFWMDRQKFVKYWPWYNEFANSNL